MNEIRSFKIHFNSCSSKFQDHFFSLTFAPKIFFYCERKENVFLIYDKIIEKFPVRPKEKKAQLSNVLFELHPILVLKFIKHCIIIIINKLKQF